VRKRDRSGAPAVQLSCAGAKCGALRREEAAGASSVQPEWVVGVASHDPAESSRIKSAPDQETGDEQGNPQAAVTVKSMVFLRNPARYTRAKRWRASAAPRAALHKLKVLPACAAR
jgi:hypothetical protein